MALKIIDHGSKEYGQMVDLRNEILRKPLGLLLTEEDLNADKNHILIGAFEDEKMLGCCMLVKQPGQVVLLRQMAVIFDLQGKGIGRALMQFAENIARDMGYREISMHARKNAAGFYEKMGYQESSNEFTNLSIPHIVMKKYI
ncbi:GNAT family N-acetyltransferase [Niabella drilacis]|uniref:Acetyltransferase (GNAT) domain-containing protein n=1 Tax=Niabella drilacis (strain DSM 25811 / CCM 8410 / CCUG 62505 / LMG 26954 / E90) TaxID=1285928 RepID=A0A1G6PNM9_NIADE|nr:GNAT family N-acetyltransferase [Niabella drilacis]SDC80967.1 Acetyltransferase (GNAT) domain-containing protein [Niabella drilacis]